MKKFFALFICTVVLLLATSSFCGCDTNENMVLEKPNNQINTSSWLEGQSIEGTKATNFSNGLALIQNRTIDNRIIYGIDKSGNLLFTLNNYENLYDSHSFVNGLFFLYNHETDEVELIDDSGKIITAKDLDATEFERFDDNLHSDGDYMVDMFNDGYIIVNKVTNSFQGTIYESAIFDSSLNRLTDYSEKIYQNIHKAYGSQTYIKDYFVWEEYKNQEAVIYVLNIKLNQIQEYSEDDYQIFLDNLVSKMNIKDYLDYELIDASGLCEMIGLTNYPTLGGISYISENMFLAIFTDKESNGYFTLTDESGVFSFEPIQYTDSCYFDTAYGIGSMIRSTPNYVATINSEKELYENNGTYDDFIGMSYIISLYDVSGNLINSTEFIKYSTTCAADDLYFSINDEAIIVADDNQVTYYDFELNILCEN